MAAKKPEFLALIPARGGSERVKNKNLRLLAQKPLLAYTIEAALASKLVSRVVVSTDSSEIARVARKYGAETPFLRPAALSQSHSTEFEFHEHALRWLLENEAYQPDLIVNLYPTGPFRKSKSIDQAIAKLWAKPQADSLRSVRLCQEHPYKMWTRRQEFLRPFVKTKSSSAHTASYQTLPQIYIQNASIYITRPRTLKKYNSTVGKTVLAYEMSEEESVDINTEIDFLTAEQIIRSAKKSLSRRKSTR